jgi:hypothetical protein
LIGRFVDDARQLGRRAASSDLRGELRDGFEAKGLPVESHPFRVTFSAETLPERLASHPETESVHRKNFMTP